MVTKETKEIKEITSQTDRSVKIRKADCEISIFSPHKEDSLDHMIEKATEIIKEHSKNDGKTILYT